MIEIVLDTETTGLAVKDGHRIVEIGCVELKNQVPTKRFFHCLLNPERKVSEDALKIHGYSDEFLSNKKKFFEIAKDFLKFISGKKLIIHNADFDLSHLNNELKMINEDIIKKDRVIDTLELAREKFPGSAINLDSLCRKFRIDYSKRQKHNALVDCELLSKVYINLIDQKEPTLDFSVQNETGTFKNKDKKFTKYLKKIIKPTPKEMQLHKDFLKNELKKNFFN
jgi:DNA polymerase-3 subunit epsilon|tara:strand:- start:2094 stop:2768 length:675 start_codon:yes stop_codon:yes gene_type:complete